ncbi:MAG: GPW/gp25 family protein [Dehalococcoidia bacterium]
MTRQDIKYPLRIDGGIGRLAQERSYGRHIDQLVRQVLLTAPGERINRPTFGCGVRRMLFAPASDATASLLQVTVLQALEKWLGDVIVVDTVEAQANDSTMDIKVSYFIRSTGEKRYLNLDAAA